ncbi:MAG: replication initiation protein [Cetobacterium sp.]
MKRNKFMKRNELVSLRGNNLSIYARKTLDYIYKNAIEIYKENRNKGIFELDIIQLKKEIGMNRTSDHLQIINELEKINNLKFETYDKKYYSNVPILAGFQVLENNILRVALSPFLIEIMFDEKKPYYHIADLMEYKPLKSKYSKIILDLYNRYKPTEIPGMSQEKFKELLGYSEKYRNNDIKKYVLEQAKKELEKHNGLKLSWEFFPNARKWSEVKLIVNRLKKESLKKQSQQNPNKKQFLGEKDLEEHNKQFEEVQKENNSMDQVEKVEKIKISKVDYEELYKKYLVDIKQEPTPINRKLFDIMNKIKYEVIEFEQQEYIQTKIYTVEDIPGDKLLDKNGNKLKGIFLSRRNE